ncbi:MAG TPA: DNA helicase I, partial [Cyclobacteriaceae bacterium]|nr:DNA helicase I [Cyclobacteriaceae bacterium]
GKSQLIANLIADGIASGKKILMVCQKRVALDVVYERLRKIGLEDFLGLVHDFRNDRKTVYEKIARQIDHIEEFKARNRNVDAIQLERRFLHVCHTIDQLAEELEEFRNALFDEREGGISIKELYLTCDPQAKSADLRQQYQHFHFSTLRDFVSKLVSYARYAALYEADDYPWRNRKSFSAYAFSELRALEQTVLDVPHFQQQLQHDLHALLNASLSLEDSEALLASKADIDEIASLLDSDAKYTYFQRLITEQEEDITPEWLQEMELLCVNCFEGEGIESTLTMPQIITVQLALHGRMDARGNPFKLLRQKFFAKNRFLLKRAMSANKLRLNRQGFESLEKRIDNRLNLEHQLTVLRERRSFADVPVTDENVAKIKTWFARQQKALRAKLMLHSVRGLQKIIYVQKLSREQFLSLLEAVFTILEKIPAQRAQWERHLTPFQVRLLLHKPDQAEELIKTLRQDFDGLAEFDKLKESLQPFEAEVIARLYDQVGEWDGGSLEELFQNSIRLAWIGHIELKYPVLRAVSAFKMEEMETALRKSVAEKQALSAEILRMRARERVYESIEYNRLNNRVTYRDLHHQTTKKKKIWPVRKVVAAFAEELFNLVP